MTVDFELGVPLPGRRRPGAAHRRAGHRPDARRAARRRRRGRAAHRRRSSPATRAARSAGSTRPWPGPPSCARAPASRWCPAINEELAATAVWGSQLEVPGHGRTVDGVIGVWYGKGPGVDRAGDPMRHGNMCGAHPNGGVLVLAGDDPSCKSSTIPCISERTLAGYGLPVLYPGTAAEIVRLGRYGIALSRASGMWVGMKITADVADGVFTLDGADAQLPLTVPDAGVGGAAVAAAAVPDARAAGVVAGRGGAVRAALGDGARVPGRQPDQRGRGGPARRLAGHRRRRQGVHRRPAGAARPRPRRRGLPPGRDPAAPARHDPPAGPGAAARVRRRPGPGARRRGEDGVRRGRGPRRPLRAAGRAGRARLDRRRRRAARAGGRRADRGRAERAAAPGAGRVGELELAPDAGSRRSWSCCRWPAPRTSAPAARTTARRWCPRGRWPAAASAATPWSRSPGARRPRSARSPRWAARARSGSGRRRTPRPGTCSRTWATARSPTPGSWPCRPASPPGCRSPTSCSTTGPSP